MLALISPRLLVVEAHHFLVKLTVSAKHRELQDSKMCRVSMVLRNSTAVVARLDLMEYNLKSIVKEDVMQLLG